jgi:opacity protein-like surface antigen
MKHALMIGTTMLVLAGTAATAQAQNKKWTDRGFVSLNAGFRPTETTFDDNVTFTVYAEQGDFDAKYKTPAGPILDVSGGVRLWRNLGVGVGVSTYRKGTAASITGRIPHPFFLDRRRDVTGDSGRLQREEIAAHLQAVWMIPVTTRIDVALFGGPSYFSVKQPLVDSLRYDESYPFDTATLSGANASTRKKSKAGFNVGGDVTYMMTKLIGFGGNVRVTHTRLRLSSTDGGTMDVDVGGAQAAAGVRFRF